MMISIKPRRSLDWREARARQAIWFGPFCFFPAQQLLLNGDMPIQLGSRALEILLALVEKPGELVGKRELIARAWPDTVVEESNLRVQIAGLRRALGDGSGDTPESGDDLRAWLPLCRAGHAPRGGPDLAGAEERRGGVRS